MQSKNVDAHCSRCHGAGHRAKDCMKKSFMRIETIAEERARKHREWQERQCQRQEKQAEREERLQKNQEKQAEWEKIQSKRQEKQAEWTDRRCRAENKARRMAEEKAKKEIEDKRRDEARKEAEEKAMKEIEEKTKCEALEKANKEMEAKPKTEAEKNTNQHVTLRARKVIGVKQSKWEASLEKSHCELYHKETQQECNDQASTRASSPDATIHNNSMHEFPKFGVSTFKMLLQKCKYARAGSAQTQGASRMSRGELAQLVSEIVAEFNRIMPGWEIPVRPHLRTGQRAVAGNCVIGVPHSRQEIKCQVIAERNGIGSDKMLEQTWSSRLLLKSASIPTCSKPQTVNNPLNTAKLQNHVAPAVKHVPNTVSRNQCQSAKLQKKLPQHQIQTKNPGKCTLKTSNDILPKFIKSDAVSALKTDPAAWPAIRSHEIEFVLDSPLSVLPTHSVCSPSLTVGNFCFKIRVFPRGTQTTAGKHLSAFVLAEPGDVEPDCMFKNVKFEITVVNWMDFTRSQVKSDTFSFRASGREIDRGWHDLVAVEKLTKSDSEWVGPTGSICVRARCQVSSPGQRWSN